MKAKGKVNKAKDRNSEGALYLSKRVVVSASRRAVAKAVKGSEAALGYKVIEKNGRIQKVHKDKSVEDLGSAAGPGRRPKKTVLD